MMCHAYENMHGVVDVVLCPYIQKHADGAELRTAVKTSSCSPSDCISTLYNTRRGKM